MADDLGMMCYHSQEGLFFVDSRPLTKADAEKFAMAKIIVREMEQSDQTIPPLYWVPLSALVPVESTATPPLTVERLQKPEKGLKHSIQTVIEQLRGTEEPCDDPDCLVHGTSEKARNVRQYLGLPEPEGD